MSLMGNAFTSQEWTPRLIRVPHPCRLRLSDDIGTDLDASPHPFREWDEEESLERAVTFFTRYGWEENEARRIMTDRLAHSFPEFISSQRVSELCANAKNLSWDGSIITSLFSGYSKDTRKSCQDRIIVHALSNFILLGILDGHGPFGGEAAQSILQILPNIVAQHIDIESADYTSRDTLEYLVKQTVKSFDKIESSLYKFLKETFTFNAPEPVDSKVSWEMSGSTCSIVLIPFSDPSLLISANIGDSQVIIGNTSLNTFKVISKDHNWKDPFEVKRATRSGGLIERFLDISGRPVGPPRVYEKSKRFPGPGLAVSRSFGDRLAHSLGVSHRPDLSIFRLGDDINLLVIASDGVWDAVDSEFVVEHFKRFGVTEEAVESLVGICVKRWIFERKGICDDISIVVLKFGPD